MANVKFTLEGEAGDFLRAAQQVTTAQGKMESRFGAMATAAVRADQQTIAGIKRVVREYAIAAEKIGAIRTRGSSAVARPRAYGVEPLSASMRSSAVPIPSTAATYALSRDVKAAAGLSSMDLLIARGQQQAADIASRTERWRAVQEQVAWNNYQLKASRITQERMRKQAFWGNAKNHYLGPAAVLGAAYGAYNIARGGANEAVENMRIAREREMEFSGDFRKLATLGGNIDDMAAKRRAVLNLSNAWGIASKEIIDAMYGIESAFSAMDGKTRDAVLTGALQFNRMQGTNMETGAKAIGKALEIYGAELRNADEAKNKLYKIVDLGDLEIEKFAMLAPDLMARAKASGVTFNEMGGAVTVATQKFGRTEKTLTSLADVFMKTQEKRDELGIDTSRGWAATLQQLAGVQPDTLMKAFGTDVGVARVLIDSRDAAAQYTGQMAELEKRIRSIGAAADEVAGKLDKLMGDAPTRFAEKSAMLKTQEQNRPLSTAYATRFGEMDLAHLARTKAVKEGLPEFVPFKDEMATLYTVAAETGVSKFLFGAMATLGLWSDKPPMRDPLKVAGTLKAIAEAKKGGREDLFLREAIDLEFSGIDTGVKAAKATVATYRRAEQIANEKFEWRKRLKQLEKTGRPLRGDEIITLTAGLGEDAGRVEWANRLRQAATDGAFDANDVITLTAGLDKYLSPPPQKQSLEPISPVLEWAGPGPVRRMLEQERKLGPAPTADEIRKIDWAGIVPGRGGASMPGTAGAGLIFSQFGEAVRDFAEAAKIMRSVANREASKPGTFTQRE